jgi:purine-nucleoside phosphorylase
MMAPYDSVRAATAAIRAAGGPAPEIAIVLGSGAGGAEFSIETHISIPYGDLPGFAAPSVAGHAGRLELGISAGVPIVVLRGRYHAYEGLAPAQVLHPVRVAAALGARTLLLTSAVGGIRDGLEPGSITRVEDHVDFAAADPLVGEHDERFGPRFVDLVGAYDPDLARVADAVAQERGVDLPRVVYGRVLGPTYETPAEVRALRSMGVDVVGMSLVPEVVAARQAAMRVLALAIVTNRAAGLEPSARRLDHEDVLAVGRSIRPRLTDLLTSLVTALGKRGGEHPEDSR